MTERPTIAAGMVVVTTATKVRLLQSLSEFWSLKSLFIQAKKDPHLLSSEVFQQRALQYFEKSSALAKQKFWASLSEEARKKAAKYFVLQEVMDVSHSRMVQTKDSAAVYIVLNGSATVKVNDGGEERIYNTGDIFGAIDIFNDAYENADKTEEKMEEESLNQNQRVMTAQMKKGTYLRISLADFYKHVLSVDKVVAGVDQEELTRIAELSWDELTDEDRFFIDVYLRAQQVLRADLFAFATTFRLIPYNARVPAAKFYKEGHIGHIIELNPSAPMLFIVLNGAVRIEIETSRQKKDTVHNVSCKRKGKKPMTVKTFSMPLLLLGAGALLNLSKECYAVGLPEDPSRPASSAHKPSTAPSSDILLLPDGPVVAPSPIKHSDSTNLNASIPDSSRTRTARTAVKPAYLYTVRLVFEKTTPYLCMPFSVFEKHLEDRVVLRGMARSIRSQVAHTSEVILSRIRNLQPWITGNLAFNGPPILSAIGDYSVTPLDDNLLTANAADKRASLTKVPMGSFTYASRLQLNTASSQTAGDYSTLQQDSTTSGRPAQPQSKLKNMINSLKKQRTATKRAMTKLSFITEVPTAVGDEVQKGLAVAVSLVTESNLSSSSSSPLTPSRRASLASGISNLKPFNGLEIISEHDG